LKILQMGYLDFRLLQQLRALDIFLIIIKSS